MAWSFDADRPIFQQIADISRRGFSPGNMPRGKNCLPCGNWRWKRG